jgi:hypothetical protein
LLLAIDEEGGDLSEEVSEDGGCWFPEVAFVDGFIHEQHPAVTGGLVDGEGGMTSAECRVTSFLQVVLWSAESEGEEESESFFGACEVVRWVHGAEDVIERDAAVEGVGELPDAVGSEELVEVIFRGGVWWYGGRA